MAQPDLVVVVDCDAPAAELLVALVPDVVVPALPLAVLEPADPLPPVVPPTAAPVVALAVPGAPPAVPAAPVVVSGTLPLALEFVVAEFVVPGVPD